MQAAYTRHDLKFTFTARTSRSTMSEKETYLIRLVPDGYDPGAPDAPASVGECAVFRGLSSDDSPHYKDRIEALCRAINRGDSFDVSAWSSIRFGLECALLGADRGWGQILFPGQFTEGDEGLAINGLVWMDSIEKMTESARAKVSAGYSTVKIKIGALDFEREFEMLDRLRLEYGPDRLTIRLDANGAFSPDDALDKLRRLSLLDIHSIEQPIKAGQWDAMAYLCEQSPVDIALDEELIGVTPPEKMHKMLYYIAPRYIILKPSLCGGLSGAGVWASVADRLGIGWWPTSALESNVGLDAIAQWTAVMRPGLCSGLGTGNLYSNNIPSPLSLRDGALYRSRDKGFDFSRLIWTVPE